MLRYSLETRRVKIKNFTQHLKTVTSLHFPSPAVIDSERGTEHYGKFFDFKRIFSADPNMLVSVIDELLRDPKVDGKVIKTLVVDSMSVIYDNLIANYESKLKIKTGNASYQLKPLDYKYIKAEVKRIGLKLLSLDMNVIVTAKEKTQYSTDPAKFMEIEGTAPEGSKELPYMMDIILHLTKPKHRCC